MSRRPPAPQPLALLWVLGAALLAACSRPAAETTETEWTLAEVRLFEADSLLHGVRDVAVTPSGETWVLTRLEPFVYRFSPEGRLEGRFGRRGQGPGELQNPGAIAAAGADGVEVLDLAGRRLAAFDAAGRPGRRVEVQGARSTVLAEIDEITYGEPFLLRKVGDRYLSATYPDGLTSTRGFTTAELRLWDGRGAPAGRLLSFADLTAGAPAPEGARFLIPIPLWAACAGGEVAVFDPGSSTVTWRDLRGATRASARVPGAAGELTRGEIGGYLRHMVGLELRGRELPPPGELDRMLDGLLRTQRHEFGTRRPTAVRMLCDHQDRAWLQEYAPAESPLGYGRRWKVVARDGRRAAVTLPAGFRPWHLAPGGATGVMRDALDVERIAFVPFPPGLAKL